MIKLVTHCREILHILRCWKSSIQNNILDLADSKKNSCDGKTVKCNSVIQVYWFSNDVGLKFGQSPGILYLHNVHNSFAFSASWTYVSANCGI